MNTWGEQPLAVLPEEQATVQALRLLTSAAEFDSATGGVNREASLYPVIKIDYGIWRADGSRFTIETVV